MGCLRELTRVVFGAIVFAFVVYMAHSLAEMVAFVGLRSFEGAGLVETMSAMFEETSVYFHPGIVIWFAVAGCAFFAFLYTIGNMFTGFMDD